MRAAFGQQPDRPAASRNSTRSSPSSLRFTGTRPTMSWVATGHQYRRSSSPIGVPGPTRVSRSFFSGLSIGYLRG